MIDHILTQSGKIVNTTTDKHGDQKVDSETDVNLRFRYITNLDKGVNQEGLSSEAIVWLDPEIDVSEASIIYADGKYWRIDRLIKARRMSGSDVQFLKALVSKHEL